MSSITNNIDPLKIKSRLKDNDKEAYELCVAYESAYRGLERCFYDAMKKIREQSEKIKELQVCGNCKRSGSHDDYYCLYCYEKKEQVGAGCSCDMWRKY